MEKRQTYPNKGGLLNLTRDRQKIRTHRIPLQTTAPIPHLTTRTINERPVNAAPVNRLGEQIKNVLVPTDLMKESRPVLSYAIAFARAFGADLTLLHVYREPYWLDYLRGPQARGAFIEHRRGAELALLELAMLVKESRIGCNIEFCYGSLCEEVAKASEHCDLLIVSTHRYGWFDRLAYGSDAQRILHHTTCPVLFVHKK